jgi:hypothetical protein
MGNGLGRFAVIELEHAAKALLAEYGAGACRIGVRFAGIGGKEDDVFLSLVRPFMMVVFNVICPTPVAAMLRRTRSGCPGIPL